jgi:hypothetical protein
MKAMLCEKDLQTKDSNEVIDLFGPDFLSLFSFIQSYQVCSKPTSQGGCFQENQFSRPTKTAPTNYYHICKSIC